MQKASLNISEGLEKYGLIMWKARSSVKDQFSGFAEVSINPDNDRKVQGRDKSFKQSTAVRRDLGISDEEWEKMNESTPLLYGTDPKRLKETFKDLFKFIDSSKKDLFKPEFLLTAFGYDTKYKGNIIVAKAAVADMNSSYARTVSDGEFNLGIILRIWPGMTEYERYYNKPENWPKVLKDADDLPGNVGYYKRMEYFENKVKGFLAEKGYEVKKVYINNDHNSHNGLTSLTIKIFFEPSFAKEDYPFLDFLSDLGTYEGAITKEKFFEKLDDAIKKYIED